MKSKCFIAFLLLINGISSFAQTPMVAYRKEGVWHYFDTKGKLMWQPFADVAADPNGWINGLLCASEMEITGDKASDIGVQRRQVLYDNKGKIVVKPKMDAGYRILTGIDKAGFFSINKYEEDKTLICDKTGKIVFESPYSYGEYLGDGVIAYSKNLKDPDSNEDSDLTLFDIKNKKELITLKCDGFYGNFEEGVVFCFNKDNKHGMIDRKGTLVQPMIWAEDIYNFVDKTALPSGFYTFKNPKTEHISLLNKKGEVVLEGFSEVNTLNKHFFKCQFDVENEQFYRTYIVKGATIEAIDEKYGKTYLGTEGSILVLEDDNHDLIIMDKKLKPIAKIKSFNYSAIDVFEHHFWTQTDTTNEYAFTCYNEKGVKTGTIEAEKWGKPAYGHVPFMKDSLWGLANESGKIIVKPAYKFEESDVPKANNGYWCVPVRLNEDNVRFDYFNFEGKMVISTTSEKDGWDFLLHQEELKFLYKPH